VALDALDFLLAGIRDCSTPFSIYFYLPSGAGFFTVSIFRETERGKESHIAKRGLSSKSRITEKKTTLMVLFWSKS